MEEVVETETWWDRIKRFFYREETPKHRRSLIEGRIERFLDENFDDYIGEYGMVTKTDIEAYEQKFTRMEDRVSTLNEFTLDLDAKVTDLERRVGNVKKKAGKTK